MITCYFDINVFAEHSLKREYFLQCNKLFQLAEDNDIKIVTASASFYILDYILRKAFNQKDRLSIHRYYLSVTEIIESNNHILTNAINSNFKDTEDAFHFFSASGNVEYFITLNEKDYKQGKSDIKIIHPVKFLKQVIIE